MPDNRKHRDTIEDGGIDGDEWWFESKMVCNALTISPSGESITLVDDDVEDDDVDDDVDGIASLPPVMAAAAAVAVVG